MIIYMASCTIVQLIWMGAITFTHICVDSTLQHHRSFHSYLDLCKMTLYHSPPLSETQRSVDCSGWRGWSRVAVALRCTLGRRQTQATDADTEWMGGATTTSSSSSSYLASTTSTDRRLVGGALLRTRGGGGGGGLGGRIDMEDKTCVGICLL